MFFGWPAAASGAEKAVCGEKSEERHGTVCDSFVPCVVRWGSGASVRKTAEKERRPRRSIKEKAYYEGNGEMV